MALLREAHQWNEEADNEGGKEIGSDSLRSFAIDRGAVLFNTCSSFYVMQGSCTASFDHKSETSSMTCVWRL